MGAFPEVSSGYIMGGRYRLDRVLDSREPHLLWRATDQSLRRPVLVQVVHHVEAEEARAAARVRHPGIASVIDFGTDARLGVDYVVMEALQGEELAARLARTGPPPLSLSLRILREAAAGLAAAHQAGVAHGGVDPGTIFLAEQTTADVLRVSVLGLGGRYQAAPPYAAPERRPGAEADGAADVYALGAVAYQLLVGEPPVTEGGQVPSPRERNPEVPREVAAVVERALAADPRQRYPDAIPLWKALEDAQLRHSATLPPPPDVPEGAGPEEAQAERAARYRARQRPRLPVQLPGGLPAEGAVNGPVRVLFAGVAVAVAALLAWWLLG